MSYFVQKTRKKLSAEHRRRISEARKGIVFPEEQRRKMSEAKQHWFDVVRHGYTAVLKRIIDYRYVVAVLIIAIFFGSVFLAKTKMKFVLFSAEGIDEFLKTADAKKLGATSRADLVGVLIRDFFEKYENATGKNFVPRVTVKTLEDILTMRKPK